MLEYLTGTGTLSLSVLAYFAAMEITVKMFSFAEILSAGLF